MSLPLFDLTGKVTIVTGSGRGIGKAIAKGLATAGAKVVLAARTVTDIEATASEIRENGGTALSVPTDVQDSNQVANLVQRTMEEFGKIDILVNNAGVVVRKPALDVTEEDWDKTMNTNLKALFFCCQLVGRELIQKKGGKIINISSSSAQRVGSNKSVYAASKAAVSHLTRALAFEWARYKVNVNAIAPGLTITDINKKHFLEKHPEDLRLRLNSIPMARAADVSEYVGAAIFLASDASDYITGHTLFVDGGVTL